MCYSQPGSFVHLQRKGIYFMYIFFEPPLFFVMQKKRQNLSWSCHNIPFASNIKSSFQIFSGPSNLFYAHTPWSRPPLYLRLTEQDTAFIFMPRLNTFCLLCYYPFNFFFTISFSSYAHVGPRRPLLFLRIVQKDAAFVLVKPCIISVFMLSSHELVVLLFSSPQLFCLQARTRIENQFFYALHMKTRHSFSRCRVLTFAAVLSSLHLLFLLPSSRSSPPPYRYLYTTRPPLFLRLVQKDTASVFKMTLPDRSLVLSCTLTLFFSSLQISQHGHNINQVAFFFQRAAASISNCRTITFDSVLWFLQLFFYYHHLNILPGQSHREEDHHSMIVKEDTAFVFMFLYCNLTFFMLSSMQVIFIYNHCPLNCFLRTHTCTNRAPLVYTLYRKTLHSLFGCFVSTFYYLIPLIACLLLLFQFEALCPWQCPVYVPWLSLCSEAPSWQQASKYTWIDK